MVGAPDLMYTYQLHGVSDAGNPVFRVVSDDLQVQYVTVLRARSDTATVEATIERALARLARPPKPAK